MDNLFTNHAANAGLVETLVRIGKSYQIWADVWLRSGWRVQENATGKWRVVSPRGAVSYSGTVEACHDFAEGLAPPAKKTHVVIILHGMGRTRRSFARLERRLCKQGLAVATVSYASLTDPPKTHLRRLRSIIDALVQDGAQKISFVSHSLGCLLVRCVLADNPRFVPGRVVFLGPPNQGSLLALRLSKFSLYAKIFGPCGNAVFASAVKDLFIPDCEIAVIAGGTGGQGYNRFLPGDNDGLVMVGETRLNGQEKFLRLPCLHGFLPTSSRVHYAVETFLLTGQLEAI